MPSALSLEVLGPALAVSRLPADAGLPWWAAGSGFLSFTRSAEETSIVCDERRVPEAVKAQRGLRALRVKGTLAFETTGVLASLATALAGAGVPVFVVSTFDTDYVLVAGTLLSRAVEALRNAGHSVEE